MAYNDPVRAQQNRLMATDPLRFSPAAREAWREQRSFEEGRRRFDASEARFREAERNRHAEQGFQDETARMTAHGQYLNDKERNETARYAEQNRHFEANEAEGNRHGEAAYRNETERGDSAAKWAEAEAARKAQQGLLGPKPPPDGRRIIAGPDGESLYWDDAEGRYKPYPSAPAYSGAPSAPAGGPPAPGASSPSSPSPGARRPGASSPSSPSPGARRPGEQPKRRKN